MSEHTVYWNGQFLDESDVKISLADRGFMLADAAFDVARTYRHIPFKLDEHIARLFASCRYLDIDPRMSPPQMKEIALRVVHANVGQMAADDDCWITMRVTRGLNPPFYSSAAGWNPPTVIVYSTPINFAVYGERYESGLHLITPSVRRTPPECIDPRAKTHERLNFVIGHVEVARTDPFALPLLLDLQGNITEAFTANVFVVRDGELWTPSRRNTLAGITQETVLELGEGLGYHGRERDITLYDVYNAEEVFLTATSFGVMPVARINGRQIGARIPGLVTEAITKAFSRLVGLDIVEQAQRHLQRV